MARITRPNDNRLLALRVRVRAGKFRAMTETIPLEVLLPLERGLVLFPRMARGLDDMARMQGTGFRRAVLLGSLQDDSPLFLLVAPRCRLQGCLGPDVQLEHLHVAFEEFCQFVLGREHGPVRREGDVGHVVEPYGIVQDELVVSPAPAVANAVFLINHEGVNVEHL